MYKRDLTHILICDEIGLNFDSIKVKYEYSLAQVPLISGGYYSKQMGKKWCELTVEGSISQSDREYYDRFLKLVNAGPKDLIADITEFKRCVLIESSISTEQGSRIDRFTMRFRSVDNV